MAPGYWRRRGLAIDGAYSNLMTKQRPAPPSLTVRERPGKQVFRFWQEGPGYDRTLTSQAAVPTALEYLHNNPVRRGLSPTPSQGKWSSWRCYHQSPRSQDPELPTVHGVPDMLRD